jgi:chromosome segregation ATPase
MQLVLNVCIFAVLLSTASTTGTEVTLSFDDSMMSPVAKVAKLLEDMLKQMEKDADDDQDVADKMFCWCETGEKEKTKAIADNEQKIEDLKAEIQALTAKSQKLNTEIDTISKELDENQKSLETAVSMRKKELQEFTASEASTMESIKQLTGASAALSKKGLMQTEITLDDSTPAYHAIKHAIRSHGDMLWAMHNEKSRKLLQQMMTHNGELSLLQTDSKAKITAPSDIIVGAINGMNDAFKTI